jgi:hypothetical protein
VLSPGRVTFAGPMLNISTGMQPSSDSSPGGRAPGSPYGQYSAGGRQYSPQPRQYSGQGSTEEEAATAEVYICLSPLTEGVNGSKK